MFDTHMTRKRRVPVYTPSDDVMIMRITTQSAPNTATVNSTVTKAFYACPPGRAEVLLDKQLHF